MRRVQKKNRVEGGVSRRSGVHSLAGFALDLTLYLED